MRTHFPAVTGEHVTLRQPAYPAVWPCSHVATTRFKPRWQEDTLHSGPPPRRVASAAAADHATESFQILLGGCCISGLPLPFLHPFVFVCIFSFVSFPPLVFARFSCVFPFCVFLRVSVYLCVLLFISQHFRVFLRVVCFFVLVLCIFVRFCVLCVSLHNFVSLFTFFCISECFRVFILRFC